MSTTKKDPAAAAKLALAAVVFGVLALFIGGAQISESHDDPSIAMCDGQQMRAGDSCTTYRNGAEVQTRTREQALADHQASLRSDATTGPILVGVGVVLLIGGVVGLGAAAAGAGRRTGAARR